MDGAGIQEDTERVKRLTKRNVIEWQSDIAAAGEIEDRLKQIGFDLLAINAEIYAQARDVIAMFEGLTHAAQHRRNLLIKEMRSGRLAKEPQMGRNASMPRAIDR